MEVAALCFIVLLVIIVLILMVYNYSIHKKIETFSNLNQRVTNLNVLQDFINTLGENTTIEEKLDRINDILINKYSIKYSTIVVFDGAEYVVKASNVDKKHWSTLQNLQGDPVFADSIKTAVPKYITVEDDSEKLPYQKMEFGRAKCAMFFPLYIDNIYIGYWIIEGSRPHEFDNLDTTILEVVRKNIVTILKTFQNQATIENIVRDDKYSGLKTAEFLYGKGKKIIDQNDNSTICLFKIVNLPYVNEKYSREAGNIMITEVSNFVKKNLSSQYLFVRYMGPKFAIVFSGADLESSTSFMNNLKNEIESLKIIYKKDNNNSENNEEEIEDTEENDNDENNEIQISPVIRVALANYYKGTSIDGALKKIEEYIDKSDENTIVDL